MKKTALLLNCVFVLGLFLSWGVPCWSQEPTPDIKVNGQDTPVCLVPPADLELSLSLESGGMTEAADWWLVVVGPTEIASLTPNGWQPGLMPAYTGPLFNLPPTELIIPNDIVPPMTPYRIFLAVDLPGNGKLDIERLYWDMGTVTNSESNGEDLAGEEAGKILFPAFMHSLKKVLAGHALDTEVEAVIAQALNDSPEALPVFNRLVSQYDELPEAKKLLLFDPEMVLLTQDPDQSLDMAVLQNRLQAVEPGVMTQEHESPLPPSGLTAANTSLYGPDPDTGEWLYRISLNWQDNSSNEDGFLIHRLCYPAILGTEYEVIGQVGPNVTSYDDDSLSAPSSPLDQCCYQVTAFKTSRFSLVGQPPSKIESSPSASACSGYASTEPPPFVDTDKDGVPDDLDDCPYDSAEGSPWTNGCPDDDGDGVANKDDSCKLVWGEKSDGCPLKYQIRWMGMDVLNNSGAHAYSGYNFTGLSGPAFNEYDAYPGEEPYLRFSFINGMTAKGAKESGTSRWCCGEKVTVPTKGAIPDSDQDGYLDNHEPDTDIGGSNGTTFMENAALLDHGLTVYPAFPGQYAEIDRDLGIVLVTSLLERDWTMDLAQDKQGSALDSALKAGSAAAGSAFTCVGSGGIGCLVSIGGAIKTLIDSILEFSKEQDPVTVKDPDDLMGSSVWAITRKEAEMKTSSNGVYGFWYPMPIPYSVSCLGWEPCPVGSGVPITMRANLSFCLVREGVPESEVKTRCQPASQVLPWPMPGISAP